MPYAHCPRLYSPLQKVFTNACAPDHKDDWLERDRADTLLWSDSFQQVPSSASYR